MKGVIALAVLRLALKLELGPEYDSNANRAETVTVQGATNIDPPKQSALLRTTTRLQLAWQSGISLLRVNGGLGAKLFFDSDVADQNMLVGQLGLDERLALGRSVDLGFSADYYDAGQLDTGPYCTQGCTRHRDFRAGSATMRLSFIDEPGDLTLSGGYRGFQYKPDPQFDFQAAQASAVAAARIHAGHGDRTHELGLIASYHLERRWFSGLRDLNTCGPGAMITSACIISGSTTRTDWFHEATLELNYLGPLLVTTGYGVQLNDSDSFGYTLLRHILTVRLAGRLPWQIYATVKAQLLFATYFDPVVLAQTSQNCTCLEDEDRSGLIVDLERPIGKTGLAVEARYSYYTNISTQVDFQRHVVYLGLSYKAGWRLGKTAPAAP